MGQMKNLKDLYRTEDLYTGYKELDDAFSSLDEELKQQSKSTI